MSSRRGIFLCALKSEQNRRAGKRALLAATAISIVDGGGARAEEGDANELLLKKLEKMERRIQSLEAELKQKQSRPPAEAAAKPAAPPASIRSANAAAPSSPPPEKQEPSEKQE